MTKLRKKHKVIMGNCMSKRLKKLADIRREDIPCGVFISKVLEQICKNISKKTGLIIMEAISEAFPGATQWAVLHNEFRWRHIFSLEYKSCLFRYQTDARNSNKYHADITE